MIAALERIEQINEEMERLMKESGIYALGIEREDLDKKIKAYVLKKGNVEIPGYLLTRVQGFRRAWNSEKLQKIVPKGLFLQIVDYIPNPDKIDELVKAGKLDSKKIDKAFEETPNAPYVKITKRKQDDGSEADRVAKALA